jgi:hypothetical protein
MPARLLVSASVPVSALIGLVLAACAGPQRQSEAPSPRAERDASPPALAEARSEWPHLSVRVTEVTRIGDHALKVRFLFVNTSAANDIVRFGSLFAAAASDADTIADAYLLDVANQRKYFVMRDDSDRAECSSGIGALRPRERRALWATFAAPPRGVTRITLRMPHVEPLEVPLAPRTP